MSVKSTLFSKAAAGLNRPFAELGFARLHPDESIFAGDFPAWRREHLDADYLICDLQPWKWGYDPWTGSSFTINLLRTPRDFETTFEHSRMLQTRYLALCDTGDLERVVALENAVRARMRIPTAEEYRQTTGLKIADINRKKYLNRSCPMTVDELRRTDLWMGYLDEQDIMNWLALLEVWLPKAIQRMASLNDLSGHVFSEEVRERWR